VEEIVEQVLAVERAVQSPESKIPSLESGRLGPEAVVEGQGGGDGLFHKMVEPNDRRDKDGGGGGSHHLDGVFDPLAFAGKQQYHCPSSAADLQRFEGLVQDEHAS
jgi:hypothetical protein